MKIFSFLIALLPLSALAAPVHVDVQGISSKKGQIVLRVWDSSESYLKESIFTQALPAKSASDGELRLTISEPLPAECAINVYHDINANGVLDTNWFGIPKEPTGMSNNPKGSFGPPSYQDAKIKLSGQEQVFRIKIEEI
ncbi:DUF2141 domain-containing protein [Agarivorans sp. Alg241-V36]|uniref:DUF2141 domain-containing protein n=1 Tax=Agarivorans sp. Alg241-V36 TaxID=2305992 RepID=UPI0013CFECE8|nr:DUF2141 domain-containing protein [Agarivorans sp. Alg241-V36]